MIPSITPETRALLENAAKACGKVIEFKEGTCKGGAFVGCFEDGKPWRPDINDGDCARMEAQLYIGVRWTATAVIATQSNYHLTPRPADVWEVALRGDDPQAARRRAALRVAAEIGVRQ